MGNGLDKINALIATRVQLGTNLLPIPYSPLPKSNRLSVYSASPNYPLPITKKRQILRFIQN